MIRRYLKVADVVGIHDLQIRKFGGGQGLRDPGQLESALFRPQSGYYEDLIQEAAALWESLSQNHPFIDGNKRTAIMSTFIFLEVNGRRVTQADRDVRAFVSELYETGTFSYDRLEKWLRENTQPI